ncbi:MAG TPA: MBL fold metallo-hydrolase [bacterium]|nr:MBL fold metallo-hydrolase [bacterium]HOL47029.1 MBL fold metallo-hydrolase [bacterium]HPQ18469.1 MBL fold metallo-hydrolase [bacterium]
MKKFFNILIIILFTLIACNQKGQEQQQIQTIQKEAEITNNFNGKVQVVFFTPDYREEFDGYSLDDRGLNAAINNTIRNNIGDAILILTPDKTILIDASLPAREKYLVIPYLQKVGRTKIDLFVVTHPHFDHYGGALYLLNNFPVEKVLVCGAPHPSNAYKAMFEIIKEKNILLGIPKEGEKLDFGANIEAEVIKSGIKEWYEDGNYNNQSIYIKMRVNKIKFLFAGDGEYESEKYILKKGYDIKANILKVAHHGSATSTFYPFLKAVNPEVGIILVGKNNVYGLPKMSVINRLSIYGTKVYRTDLVGNIYLETDGDTYTIKVDYPANIKFPQFEISAEIKDKYLEYESLGEEALRLNKTFSAIKYYNEAIKLYDKNPTTYQKLGYAYRRDFDFKRAEENFLKALAIDDNEAFSHLYLGLFYAYNYDKNNQKDEKEKALNHLLKFKKILSRSPVDNLVDETIYYLKNGIKRTKEEDYYDRY